MAMRILLLLIMLSSFISARGQQVSSDSLKWNASGFTDAVSNTIVENAPCQFISYGNNRVDWVQGGGSFVSTLTTSSVNGTWSDVSNNGSIVYNFSMDTLTGQITFSRSASALTVTLVLTGGTREINNVYTITTIDHL